MIAETRRISRQARDFTEAYYSALKEYVSGANESAIRRAYELGRVALAEGMGVLEMAALQKLRLSISFLRASLRMRWCFAVCRKPTPSSVRV
jgi:hypothetical protein